MFHTPFRDLSFFLFTHVFFQIPRWTFFPTFLCVDLKTHTWSSLAAFFLVLLGASKELYDFLTSYSLLEFWLPTLFAFKLSLLLCRWYLSLLSLQIQVCLGAACTAQHSYCSFKFTFTNKNLFFPKQNKTKTGWHPTQCSMLDSNGQTTPFTTLLRHHANHVHETTPPHHCRHSTLGRHPLMGSSPVCRRCRRVQPSAALDSSCTGVSVACAGAVGFRLQCTIAFCWTSFFNAQRRGQSGVASQLHQCFFALAVGCNGVVWGEYVAVVPVLLETNAANELWCSLTVEM